MKRYLNIEAIIEGCLCLAFAGLMFYMAYSDTYLLYVTPRMKPYLYFTSVMLLLWSIFRFKRAGKPKYKVRLAKCLVLVIPFLVIFFPYSPMAFSVSNAQYTGESEGKTKVKEGSGNSQKDAGGELDTSKAKDTPQGGQNMLNGQAGNPDQNRQVPGGSETGTSKSGFQTKVPSGLDEGAKTITVAQKEFYQWMVELDQHPEKYEGYEIKIHGSVLRSQGVQDNEFSLTRLMMSCCVADLAYCGITCQWDDSVKLQDGKWLDVTGTIQYSESGAPRIIIKEVDDAYPAEEQYVYPFTY